MQCAHDKQRIYTSAKDPIANRQTIYSTPSQCSIKVWSPVETLPGGIFDRK